MLRLASWALLGALSMSPAAHAAGAVYELPSTPSLARSAVIDRAESQAYCTALALYFEGGSIDEPEAGLRHIADVIEGRSKENLQKWGGSDLCEVVFKKAAGICQFSFACLPLHKRIPILGAIWGRMMEIAREALGSERPLESDVARYYHNPDKTSCRVQRAFWREFVPLGFAGRHIFFRPPADREERLQLANVKPPECQKPVAKAKAKRFAKLDSRSSKKRSRHASR